MSEGRRKGSEWWDDEMKVAVKVLITLPGQQQRWMDWLASRKYLFGIIVGTPRLQSGGTYPQNWVDCRPLI